MSADENFALRQTLTVLGWGWVVCLFLLSVVPADLRPDTGVGHELEHLGAFFLAGALLTLRYRQQWAAIAAFFVVYAGSIELIQIVIPGRHSRVSDFILNCLGASLAIATTQIFARLKHRLKPS